MQDTTYGLVLTESELEAIHYLRKEVGAPDRCDVVTVTFNKRNLIELGSGRTVERFHTLGKVTLDNETLTITCKVDLSNRVNG